MSDYKVVVIRTAGDWKACFTGDGGYGYYPGGGCSHVGSTQAEAETAMRETWGDELAPTCTEEHGVHANVALRCHRTDCPILHIPPTQEGADR